jgi:hypothetical protein
MLVRLSIIMDETIYKWLKKQAPSLRMSTFINEAVRGRLRLDRSALDAAYTAARKETWRNSSSDDPAVSEAEG